jgi:hypothetical protein
MVPSCQKTLFWGQLGPCARARVAAFASIAAIVVYALALAIFKWLPLYDCVVLVPLLAAIFRELDRAPPRLRAASLSTLSAVLAIALLARLWTLGYEGRNAIFGGILPWSDSGDFLSDALRLVHGERFTAVSSRRPLFVALLSGLLKLGGGNLRVALAVLATIGAFSVTLPALEIWRTHGWKSAFVVYLILVFFLRRWTGFVQTEHLGLPLGAIGFALLWRASESSATTAGNGRSAARAATLGLFALTLGLFARAGCFFVLPAIAFWGRDLAASRKSALLLGAYLAAGLCAWSIHEGVLVAVGNGTSFSDYPPIFYGMLHGEDFTLLSQIHPEIAGLSGRDLPAAQWSIVLSELRGAPWLLPIGLARSFAGFFTSPFGLFSCVWTNPDDHIFENSLLMKDLWKSGGLFAILAYWRRTLGIFSIANAAVMGAIGAVFVAGFAAGLVRVFRRPDDRNSSLLRNAAVGILASVPFMPPWITSGMQIQTVTLAFISAIPAVLLKDNSRRSLAIASTPTRTLSIAVATSLGAYLVLVAWVRAAPRHAPTPLAVASAAAPLHWVDLDDSATVEVMATRSLSIRRKGLDDLNESIRFLAKHFTDLTTSLLPFLSPGTLFHSAYDPSAGHWEILIDDRKGLDGRRGWAQVQTVRDGSPRVQRLLSP